MDFFLSDKNLNTQYNKLANILKIHGKGKNVKMKIRKLLYCEMKKIWKKYGSVQKNVSKSVLIPKLNNMSIRATIRRCKELQNKKNKIGSAKDYSGNVYDYKRDRNDQIYGKRSVQVPKRPKEMSINSFDNSGGGNFAPFDCHPGSFSGNDMGGGFNQMNPRMGNGMNDPRMGNGMNDPRMGNGGIGAITGIESSNKVIANKNKDYLDYEMEKRMLNYNQHGKPPPEINFREDGTDSRQKDYSSNIGGMSQNSQGNIGNFGAANSYDNFGGTFINNLDNLGQGMENFGSIPGSQTYDYNQNINANYNPNANQQINANFNPNYNPNANQQINTNHNPNYKPNYNPNCNENGNRQINPNYNPNYNQNYSTNYNPNYNSHENKNQQPNANYNQNNFNRNENPDYGGNSNFGQENINMDMNLNTTISSKDMLSQLSNLKNSRNNDLEFAKGQNKNKPFDPMVSPTILENSVDRFNNLKSNGGALTKSNINNAIGWNMLDSNNILNSMTNKELKEKINNVQKKITGDRLYFRNLEKDIDKLNQEEKNELIKKIKMRLNIDTISNTSTLIIDSQDWADCSDYSDYLVSLKNIKECKNIKRVIFTEYSVPEPKIAIDESNNKLNIFLNDGNYSIEMAHGLYTVCNIINTLQEGLVEIGITLKKKEQNNKVIIKNIDNDEFEILPTELLNYIGFDNKKYCGSFCYVSESEIDNSGSVTFPGLFSKIFDIEMDGKFHNPNIAIDFKKPANVEDFIVRIQSNNLKYYSDESHIFKFTMIEE